MAVDYKYGKVTTEFGNIGEDEPVFVFRSQDKVLPKVLSYYALFCMKENSPRRHIDLVLDAIDKVKNWQKNNADKVRVPSSESSKAWMTV